MTSSIYVYKNTNIPVMMISRDRVLFQQSLPMRVFTPEQVAEHNNEKDCWIIIHGKVYDVTSFLPEHPGGAGIILKA
jgi:cytochrome b involved in lipid metabolism